MGRPKGSVNKPKEVASVSFVTEAKKWVPQPDMGKIVEPLPLDKECVCLHKKETHYGGLRGWCNTHGCNCQAFKV